MSIDWVLTALVIVAIVSWPATVMLLRLARQEPRIRALTERALYSLVITIFMTVYLAVIWLERTNPDFLASPLVHNIIRVGVVIIGLYPLVWLWLYVTNRFHDGTG